MKRTTRKTCVLKIDAFSKVVIILLSVAWFIGMILGVAVVITQTVRSDASVSLADLLMYIGAPMTGGIISYMLKSAFENKEKIKKNTSDSPSDIDSV